MKPNPPHALEQFWSLLRAEKLSELSALLAAGASFDDPLFDKSIGDEVHATAIPRLATWYQRGASERPIQHLRTIANEKRVVVESVLGRMEGLAWNQADQRSERTAELDLAVAVVGDRAPGEPGAAERYRALRIYFSTWAVLDGKSRLRVGPIAPDERAETKAIMDGIPAIKSYFECLAGGHPSMADQFEPDGYFREPANNFACGRDQLLEHFEHILKLGGVGIEFLTATRENSTIGLELQTVVWGTKRMAEPQAGFAAYDLGPHGRIQGGRVYDSVVPPEF